MAFLTDRTLATGVTLQDLIHIVITGDTSQNPAGSSYKATIQQVSDAIFSGFTGITQLYETGSGNYSTQRVGVGADASGDYSVVSGGRQNTSSGYYSTVSGGYFNTTISGYSAIVGGFGNRAIGTWSFIGGGNQNTTSGDYANVSGGFGNRAICNRSFIGGGYRNTTSGCTSTITGGLENLTTSAYSTISGGYKNTSNSCCGSVGGGSWNTISGARSVIAGGGGSCVALGNRAICDFTSVLGGSANLACRSYATVGGGLQNTASCNYSFVGGGQLNTASGIHSVVGGGQENKATCFCNFVGGGGQNTALGFRTTIAGGRSNTTSSTYSIIGGGWGNKAICTTSVIGGGRFNVACGDNTSILGGVNNTSISNFGTILGGSGNTVNHELSGAFGKDVISVSACTFHVNYLALQNTPETDVQTTTQYLTRDSATGVVKTKLNPGPTVYGLFAQTGNSVTISATTVEATLIDGGVGTLSVPANGFVIGDSFRADFGGLITVKSGGDTIRIRITSNGGTVIFTDNTFNLDAIATPSVWMLTINFTIRNLGGFGVASIVTLGNLQTIKTSSSTPNNFAFNQVNSATFNTTVLNTLNVTAQWGSNNTSNSIYSDIFILNKIY